MPPIPELRLTKQDVIALYQSLRKPGTHHYDNLDLQADMPKLSTRHPGDGESACLIGSDRIRIVEDQSGSGMTMPDFTSIVKDIVTHFGINKIPLFTQRCTMRFTAQPINSEDAVELLADKVANVYQKVAPFGRPPQFFGVRFRFPPPPTDDENDEETESGDSDPPEVNEPKVRLVEAKGETEDDSFITLRLEPHTKDAKQIWIEISAAFPGPFKGGDLESVERNIKYTYEFVTEKTKNFLDQFDVKES